MTRPVQFTRASAERIAAVVRAAELTPRPGSALEFDRVDAQRKVFRIGAFAGAWPKGATNTVVLPGGVTLIALNLFAGIGAASGLRACAVARDGAAWYLIAAEC